MKKQGGILRQWCQITIPGRDGDVVVGNLYEDERWSDGTSIRTSPIVTLDETSGILETRNTIYQLEDKLPEDQAERIRQCWA